MKKQILLVIALIFFAGCSAKPQPKLYHLGVTDPPVHLKSAKLPLIVIEELRLPSYMDRPQLVSKKDDFELNIHEKHRWAAPLDKLLRENLSARLNSRFYDFSLIHSEIRNHRQPPTLKISINILDFSSDSKKEVRLCGSYIIKSKEERSDEKPFDIRVFNVSEDISSLPASLSLAIEGLSEELANEIRKNLN